MLIRLLNKNVSAKHTDNMLIHCLYSLCVICNILNRNYMFTWC